MPRGGKRPQIEYHPRKQDIDRDLATKNGSNREIARRYGLNETAVRTYLASGFAEGIRRAQRARQINSDEFIYDQLMQQLEKLKKQRDAAQELQDAAFEWLRVKGKVDMTARAEEQEIVYYLGDEMYRERLDKLLKRIEAKTGGRTYTVNSRTVDNRELAIKALKAVTDHIDSEMKNIQIWMKAHEGAQREQRREAIEEFISIFVPALMEATDGKQELRRAASEALRVTEKALGSQ